MPIGGENSAFEQCSAVYEVLRDHSRDRALIYLMDKFGVDLVNEWLNWRSMAGVTRH